MIDFFRRTDWAGIYERAGLTAVDIGSRGGFDPDLLPIAWAVGGIGFEPEPQAFAHLQTLPAAPWRSVRWLPYAVGAVNGPATLWVPPDPVGASLLEHDPVVGAEFGLDHLVSDCRAVAVETVTLDHALRQADATAPDYIKLDVEGAELMILQNAPDALAGASAVKAEAAFVPVRRGQPLVADLEQFMRAQGFVLMDIRHPTAWRTRPVAPHPYSQRPDPGYSRGRIGQCDLLFFRRCDAAVHDDPIRARKAGLIAMALGYFDHALPLLKRSGADGADAMLARASRRFGRRIAAQTIRARLRELIPLARSYFGGVPG